MGCEDSLRAWPPARKAACRKTYGRCRNIIYHLMGALYDAILSPNARLRVDFAEFGQILAGNVADQFSIRIVIRFFLGTDAAVTSIRFKSGPSHHGKSTSSAVPRLGIMTTLQEKGDDFDVVPSSESFLRSPPLRPTWPPSTSPSSRRPRRNGHRPSAVARGIPLSWRACRRVPIWRGGGIFPRDDCSTNSNYVDAQCHRCD